MLDIIIIWSGLYALTSLIHRDYISITKLWWEQRYDYKNDLHCDTTNINVASSKFGAHRDARYVRCNYEIDPFLGIFLQWMYVEVTPT